VAGATQSERKQKSGFLNGCRSTLERKDGYLVLPWHGLGSVEAGAAFAFRLHELTGCLIADRRNGCLRGALIQP
jgi:hypothetical protein